MRSCRRYRSQEASLPTSSLAQAEHSSCCERFTEQERVEECRALGGQEEKKNSQHRDCGKQPMPMKTGRRNRRKNPSLCFMQPPCPPKGWTRNCSRNCACCAYGWPRSRTYLLTLCLPTRHSTCWLPNAPRPSRLSAPSAASEIIRRRNMERCL